MQLRGGYWRAGLCINDYINIFDINEYVYFITIASSMFVNTLSQ